MRFGCGVALTQHTNPSHVGRHAGVAARNRTIHRPGDNAQYSTCCSDSAPKPWSKPTSTKRLVSYEMFFQCNRSQTSVDGAQQSPESKQQPKGSKSVNDCIPVLKPVPSLPVEESQNAIVTGRPQVEILPLPALQRLLAAELPDTRLKLLRIPFHATWRQTFNDFD